MSVVDAVWAIVGVAFTIEIVAHGVGWFRHHRIVILDEEDLEDDE